MKCTIHGSCPIKGSPFHPRRSRTSSPFLTHYRRFDPPNLRRGPGYPIPEIDIGSFLKCLLPPMKDGINAENVVLSLKSEGLVGRSGAWQGFEAIRKKRAKRTRRSAFAPLVEIFEKAASLATATAPSLKQNIEMVLVPKRRRISGRRLSQPAGYFILRNEGEAVTSGRRSKRGTCSWFDVALAADFWKQGIEEYTEDINIKAVSNIQRILSRDPCRRFSFGITAEDANMRLWFCTRGTPVVSKPFDFTKEPHLLTHIFLSLAFASKEELGWDPSIRPFTSSNGKWAYHIDVGDETYETVQVLAESGAETLVSRATRVWKVKRPGSDEPYVLKDVWLEDDQEVEHAIYEMLLHDVEVKYGKDVLKEVALHLLTPVAHWLVPVNGEEDHTTRVMMRGYSPTCKQPFRIDVEQLEIVDGEGSEVPVSNGIVFQDLGSHTLRAPLPRYNPVRKVLHRRHYRVVFREAAKTLCLVRDLDDVFTVLSDSAKVLKWIHGSGWVHRDISVGNMYLHEGRGLVGDLEFAKRRNFDAIHEQRAGTVDFMAVEAEMRLYVQAPQESHDELEAQIAALREGRFEDLETMQDARTPPPFFHNDLHDLESLWWILIWELMAHRVVSKNCASDLWTADRDRDRKRSFIELFPGSDETENRRQFLLGKGIFNRRFAWLPGQLHGIRSALNTLRETLVNKYTVFEAKLPAVGADTFDGAHSAFEKLFIKCRGLARDAKLVLHGKEDPGTRIGSPSLPGQPFEHPVSHERGQPSLASNPRVEKVEVVCPEDCEAVGSTRCLIGKGKRKREDEGDGMLSMPPLQLPRQVFYLSLTDTGLIVILYKVPARGLLSHYPTVGQQNHVRSYSTTH